MPRVTDFSTLTFDCYGTLIDWERGILAELRPWADRHGRTDLRDDEILETFGTIEAACEAETPLALYPEILAEVHRRLARQCGIAASKTEAAEFGQSVGRWPAFPDSAEALAYLKRHYKLVILSNVDRASFAKSNEKLGVAFDLVVTAQDVGAYKPNLKNFEHALAEIGRRFGVGREKVLHTAQSLFHDHVPAKQVGLKTVWINRRKAQGGWGATPPPAGVPTPDFEVESMAAFAALHRSETAGPRS
jgi:2-haloacid dehalogenase